LLGLAAFAFFGSAVFACLGSVVFTAFTLLGISISLLKAQSQKVYAQFRRSAVGKATTAGQSHECSLLQVGVGKPFELVGFGVPPSGRRRQ
jgi:hypothetical protein